MHGKPLLPFAFQFTLPADGITICCIVLSRVNMITLLLLVKLQTSFIYLNNGSMFTTAKLHEIFLCLNSIISLPVIPVWETI